MNRTRMIVLAISAVALSVLVSLFAYGVLKNRTTPIREKVTEEVAQVVVAAQRLPLGVRLTERNLRLAPWSRAVSLKGSFTDPKEIVGRGVIVPMISNEPVLESKLAPREAGAGLTPAIPDGMRAVGVKVNDVIGVAGFALPGTRVDVILTGTNNKVETSKVILENIQVLAADQNVEQDANGGAPESTGDHSSGDTGRRAKSGSGISRRSHPACLAQSPRPGIHEPICCAQTLPLRLPKQRILFLERASAASS